MDLSLNMVFKPTLDVEKEIVNLANTGNYDLTIIGTGESVFSVRCSGKFLGVTHKIINPEKLDRNHYRQGKTVRKQPV